MVVAIGDKEVVELEKNVTFKPKKRCCNFRLTVEPLGFLVLTAGIIQVTITISYTQNIFRELTTLTIGKIVDRHSESLPIQSLFGKFQCKRQPVRSSQ